MSRGRPLALLSSARVAAGGGSAAMKVAPPPALLEVTAPGWEPSFLRAVIDTTRLLLIKPEISC